MANTKNIKYLNEDFSSFKQKLIDYTKTYFKDTYNDFSPASPGMMFIEMASYVGDVLSFYLDNQVQETFIQYVRQESNLFNLAYMLGYRPKVTSAAYVDIDFYQVVPSITSGSIVVPDFNYTLNIGENTQISSNLNDSIKFLVGDAIDFSFSSSLDPTEISVYEVTSNQPSKFLLKKTKQGISATIKSETFSFGAPEQFQTIQINDTQIIGVLDIIDSDGNIWYEVDYLAQDTIFDSIKNTNVNDPNFYTDASDAPYLLKLRTVDRRFVTRFKDSDTLQIQFGSGTSDSDNEEIIPNPDNVGLGLPFEKTKLTTAFSPNNFMFTDSYGISPSNTTLTVRYLKGGGVESNIDSNTLASLDNYDKVKFNQSNLNNSLSQEAFDSLQINNQLAASGGGDGDSPEDIKQNSSAQFHSQLRTVTEYDYIVRALSLPSKFGSIAKVFTAPKPYDQVLQGEKITSLDLYTLAYDNEKHLKTPSLALKNNLKTYLSQYRMINDTVDIKNGYIINIGVEFDIVVLPNYNSNEVIIKCIEALKDFFNIDKWSMNQPIQIKDLYVLLDQVIGVQTVKRVVVNNKAGVELGYSEFGYDIGGATINDVIYPSIDPSIFELKYPDTDIKGRVVGF